MARTVRLLADVRPLRESVAFRRLWASTTLSAMGGSMTFFAVTLQVYELTGSPFAVGLLGVARMVPTLAIGLLGGSVADAIDRRKLVLVTTASLTIVAAALAAQAVAGLQSLWLLYGLVATQAGLRAVDGPARNTFMPGLLPAAQVPAGLALNRLSFQITLTVGPALAGFITAATGGLQACYLIDTASFAAGLYGVARLPAMRSPGEAARPGLRAVAAGLTHIRRSPVLAGAFLTDLSATVLGLPSTLFPAINAERFGGSAWTLGLLTAAVGVGGLVSSIFSGPVGHLRRRGLGMLAMVATWGAAFACFALAGRLWLALTALAVAGGADTFTVVLRSAIVQSVTPDPLRGRITAAEFVVDAGGSELGNLEAGALGSLTTPTISALSGGLACLLGAALIAVTVPAFARYREQPAVPSSEATGEPVAAPA